LGLGWPGLRPWLARSSLQVAQGQASRSQAKVQAVAVLPVDLQSLALGEQDAHLLRGDGDARQGAVVFRLARRVFLVDKADAFVAHDFSLQWAAARQ